MKYNFEEISKKAEYCLNCKTKPCKNGCPLNNNIPDFIKCIKEEKYEEAFEVLLETTIFEPICGRICPQKIQCEGSCVRNIKGESVHIGELETFIGDYALEKIEKVKIEKKNNKKIAIIGSGPAGLACACYLSTNGYDVHIYEKHSKLGGLLRYGIPEFRLDKEILDNWLNKYILNENVTVHTNIELEKDISLEELEKHYDNVILAFGANISNKMNILGEDKKIVLGGNELLEYRNMPDFKNKKVAVIGGGNVAMDVSRTVKKIGAEKVTIIYRRAEEQMPASKKEIEDAKKEKIDFLFQTNMIKVLDKKIECVKTKLIKKEGEDREYPVNIENSNFFIDIDYVILALGSSADNIIINKLGIEVNKWGYINVNNNYKTSINNVYAVGDLIGNKKTVAWAVRSGFECAKSIIKNNYE